MLEFFRTGYFTWFSQAHYSMKNLYIVALFLVQAFPDAFRKYGDRDQEGCCRQCGNHVVTDLKKYIIICAWNISWGLPFVSVPGWSRRESWTRAPAFQSSASWMLPPGAGPAQMRSFHAPPSGAVRTAWLPLGSMRRGSSCMPQSSSVRLHSYVLLYRWT